MNKALQAIGMSMRAGKCIAGEETVIKAIRQGEAKLVLLAEDASENTAKKVMDKCAYYGVSVHQCFNRKQLGSSTGKGERVTLAITDTGFTRLIEQCLGNTLEVEQFE